MEQFGKIRAVSSYFIEKEGYTNQSFGGMRFGGDIISRYPITVFELQTMMTVMASSQQASHITSLLSA